MKDLELKLSGAVTPDVISYEKNGWGAGHMQLHVYEIFSSTHAAFLPELAGFIRWEIRS